MVAFQRHCTRTHTHSHTHIQVNIVTWTTDEVEVEEKKNTQKWAIKQTKALHVSNTNQIIHNSVVIQFNNQL